MSLDLPARPHLEYLKKQAKNLAAKRINRRHCQVVIYEALVEGKLEAPKRLARTVHDLYFAEV